MDDIFDRLGDPQPKVYNRHYGYPKDAIYVGRGTPYGNPFRTGVDGTRIEVIEKFRREILPTLDVEPLRGYNLVCSCKPKLCHADWILLKANKPLEIE